MSFQKEKLQSSIKKLKILEKETDKKIKRIGFIRLGVFLFTLVFGLLLFFFVNNWLSQLLFVLGSVVFIIVSIWQSNFIKYHKKLNNWIALKESILARTQLDWQSIKRKKIIEEKDYTDLEVDLNIIGDKSLLHLVDLTGNSESYKLLRSLFNPDKKTVSEIILRQNAIKELLKFNRFRDRFLLNNFSQKGIGNSNILKWLKTESKLRTIQKYLSILFPIALINILLICLSILGILHSYWMITSFIYISIYYSGYKYYRNNGQISDLLDEDLRRNISHFELVEKTQFDKYPTLFSLLKPIKENERPPSKHLIEVKKILSLLAMRSNPFLWLFLAIIFPVDFIITYRLENIKERLSKNYGKWEATLNTLDALISLATFSKINSEYKFPKFSEEQFGFQFKGMGHPLIPKEKKICNDFSFTSLSETILVTGSNMSGKSTFLRTVGINICLAYSGCVVNASHFHTSILILFTCIKVSDSVIDGISYFYSEVKRLKKLLLLFNENHSHPIFYLIDEIFKGTNNIERRIGSKAYINYLATKNGVGFISTHDIELVNLEEENNKIKNYHFRETIAGNKLEFDYKLREGPCPTTNALKIMEMEGLPVKKGEL